MGCFSPTPAGRYQAIFPFKCPQAYSRKKPPQIVTRRYQESFRNRFDKQLSFTNIYSLGLGIMNYRNKGTKHAS